MFKSTDISFVTGAGSGIGRATCQVLADQGATIVAADINKEAADQTVSGLTGSNHSSAQVDVTQQAAVMAAIDDVIAKYSSPPTIAVNCAGLLLVEPLKSLTDKKFDRIFNVNVKGTMWVTQAVCGHLVSAKRKGAVVNLASIAKEGFPLLSVYSATKGAVEAFTFSAAKEFGPHGIRVNVVCPSFTDTPMIADFPESVKNMYKEMNPLNRHARPEEIAEVIAFLASDKSSYVNGTSMNVHGGQGA